MHDSANLQHCRRVYSYSKCFQACKYRLSVDYYSTWQTKTDALQITSNSEFNTKKRLLSMDADPTVCQVKSNNLICPTCNALDTAGYTESNSSYCISGYIYISIKDIHCKSEKCADNCAEPSHDSCSIRSNECSVNGICTMTSLPDMTSCFLGNEPQPFGVCSSGFCISIVQQCVYVNNQLNCSHLRKSFFCLPGSLVTLNSNLVNNSITWTF